MDKLVQTLREALASTFVLYFRTHAVHWNIEGPDFFGLHKMLDEQYTEMWASIDDMAERLRALDEYAPESLEVMMAFSRIDHAAPAAQASPRDALMNLMMAQEIVLALLTEAMAMATAENEQGLANFLGGRIEAHQKHRWMLRASAKPIR